MLPTSIEEISAALAPDMVAMASASAKRRVGERDEACIRKAPHRTCCRLGARCGALDAVVGAVGDAREIRQVGGRAWRPVGEKAHDPVIVVEGQRHRLDPHIADAGAVERRGG